MAFVTYTTTSSVYSCRAAISRPRGQDKHNLWLFPPLSPSPFLSCSYTRSPSLAPSVFFVFWFISWISLKSVYVGEDHRTFFSPSIISSGSFSLFLFLRFFLVVVYPHSFFYPHFARYPNESQIIQFGCMYVLMNPSFLIYLFFHPTVSYFIANKCRITLSSNSSSIIVNHFPFLVT